MGMKISDMIKKLKETKDEHGNLLVVLSIINDGALITIREEDFSICSDGDKNINDYETYIDELEDKKVLAIGEW